MTDINAWRKRISHPIRSKTPITDDIDDRHSDHGSEHSGSRHRPRPKLSKYLSTYLALAAPPKPDELFATNFWENLGQSQDFEEKVDPYVVVQSISTMLLNNPHKDIPATHNSGLLNLIENYRNLREEKEKIEDQLKQILDGFKEAEEIWATEEHNFRSEIKRLELIIARGKQGMTELMRARQGSVIRHQKRKLHKTPSEEQLETAYEFLSRDQIDQDLMREGQRVVFTRSKSPSNQMKALSRTLSNMNVYDDLPFGSPPDRRHKHSLSYLAKTNAAVLSHYGSTLPTQGEIATPTGHSEDPSDTYSTFSSAGDPLPDEEGDTMHTVVDARAEGEDFLALRDLVIQVARRRGMRVETVLPRLVDLLDGKDSSPSQQGIGKTPSRTPQGVHSMDRSHERRLRQSRSQPQLNSDLAPRRHFSFDPGDDTTITALDQVASEFASLGENAQRSSHSETETPGSEVSLPTFPAVNSEALKPSMIPSPVQDHLLARIRREESPSSILTSILRDAPRRTDSSASSVNSVATAVQHSSSKKSKKRIVDGPDSSTGANKSGRHRLTEQSSNLRNSFALAAARAVGSGSGQSSGTEGGTIIKRRYRQHSNSASRSSNSSRLLAQQDNSHTKSGP